MEKQAQFTNKKLLFNKSLDFPESPGVYKFFNSQNKILYIGKAKNIKNRVKSYLNIRKSEGKRIAKLKASIKYIETIITSVLQEILNVLDFQMSLEESSDKSRIHFQHLPDILFYEKLDNRLIKNLEKDKKLVKRKLGEIHSILLKKDGIEAFSDKRRPDGKASSIYK